jgi:hypothetical protein
MTLVHDVVVVGSGACGSMAAQTLVESGRTVLMLDGGRRDARWASIVPDAPFVKLRTTDPEQHRYFLGDDFESLANVTVKTGAQLTPPRRYLVRDVDRYLKVRAPDFSPLESLATGGLAAGWGLGSAVFSQEELELASLPAGEMREAYEVVADRIGLSGADDDARAYMSAHIGGIQPALPIDPTAGVLLRNYERRRGAVKARDFYVGRPTLALLSEPKDGRRASLMHDMEFYSDHGSSAWRAWMTVDQLGRCEGFSYQPDSVVLRFEEHQGTVDVTVLDTTQNVQRQVRCRRLVLASGALGTARIVLRSQADRAARLQLLCNPYTYVPCIVPGRLGKDMPERNIALCQLAIFHDPGTLHNDVAMGFVYSYRSLMMFRLMREVPLSFQLAPVILRYLMSGMLILGIHHPHTNAGSSYVTLESDPASPTGDQLFIDYRLTVTEVANVEKRERAFMECMRTLGAIPTKLVRPGNGSSIHYAGTVPFSAEECALHTGADGRLHHTERVYVADSSAFTYLPAKGVTLSSMARAHSVAKQLPSG